jgi:quinol monooxygenase YgiN
MPVVSITRLRVRSWRYLPAFFVRTLLVLRQTRSAEGNLKVALLKDARNTFWTSTSWSSHEAIKAFMHAPPHGPAMRKLLNWCDEASLVHWTQDGPDLPDWHEAHRRLEAEGRPSKVYHPSAAHTAHKFPPPIVRTTNALRVKT